MTEFTDAWAEGVLKVQWWHELLEVCSVDGANLVGIQAALLASLQDVHSHGLHNHTLADRAGLSAIFAPSNLRAGLLPLFKNLGEIAGRPGTDIRRLHQVVEEYMDANTLTVKERNLTTPTLTANGGNVGNGSILRCLKNKYDDDIEGIHLEAKRFECDRDQGNLTRNQEEFVFRGAAFEFDLCKIVGSGLQKRPLKCVDAKRAAAWVSNPSFDTNSAAADEDVPTSITDWTIDAGVIGSLKMRNDSGYVFQATQGLTAEQNWAIEFTDDVTIGQILRAKKNPKFSDYVPYHCGIRVMRKASATGNITLYNGSQNAAKAIGDLTNDVWYNLYIGGTVHGDESWYRNFQEDNLNVQVKVDTLAIGTVVIDHLVYFPLTFIDGSYYIALSGSTPFALNDFFSWTDSLAASEAVIQYFLWRAGLPSLPHAASPTIADP